MTTTKISKMLAFMMALSGWTAAGQSVYHVNSPQTLQNALTFAAASSVSNVIYVTNGYYLGNFNFNSTNVNSLAILPETGVSNTQITIDSGGTGCSMSMSVTATAAITVQGMTFLRNCGNTSLAGLRIAAANTSIFVNGCLFLSPSNSSGMGLDLVSGVNATITNCTATGATNGGGGTGIYISVITNNVLVQNCTITTNNSEYGAAGGLYVYGASVIAMSNCLISHNSSYYAPGGSSCSGTTATLFGNTFTGNSSFYAPGGSSCSGTTITLFNNSCISNFSFYGGGGASCSGATITLSGNTFSGNLATNGNGGGAVCSASGSYLYTNDSYIFPSAVILSNNTFTGNSAGNSSGGGVYCFASASYFYADGPTIFVPCPVAIVNNMFNDNSAGNSGGGVYCATSGGTNFLTVAANMFSQNSAVYGGGFYASSPTVDLLGNLIASNTVIGTSSQGGGIWVDASGTLNMVNNTVTGNSSPGSGGGVAYIVTGTVELLNIYNNIIWGNTATVSGGDVYLSGTGQHKVFDFNDVDSIYGVFDLAQTNLDVSPQFFNPVGGDYHLQSTSPCLSAGTSNAPSLPATDLDGNPRIINGLVNLGCYEFTTNVFHPADLTGSWVITASEFAAYAAAWKNGQSWSNAPNPVPANYMTRAGYLMTNGGSYYNDGSARPVNWKTN